MTRRHALLLLLFAVLLAMPLLMPITVTRAQDCTVDTDGDGWDDCTDQCDFDPAPNDPTGCPPTPIPANTDAPQDRDGDGTLDGVDQCPDVGGPSWAGGCPADSTAVPQAATSIPLPALPNDGSCVGATQTVQAVNVRANPSISATLAGTLASSRLYPLSLAVEIGDETWYALSEPAGFVADWVIRHNTCDQIPSLHFEAERRDWRLVLMQEGRVVLDEDMDESAALADGDVMSLAFIVMMEASRSAQEDLKAIMSELRQLSIQRDADLTTLLFAEPDCTGAPPLPIDCLRLQISSGRDVLSFSLVGSETADVEILIQDLLNQIQAQQQTEAEAQDSIQQSEEAEGNLLENLQQAGDARDQIAGVFGLGSTGGSGSSGEARLLSLSFQAVEDGLVFDLTIGDPANLAEAVHAQIHVDTTNPDAVDPNALFEVRYGDAES